MSVDASYASRLSGATSGIRSKCRLAKIYLVWIIRLVVVSPLVLFAASWEGVGAESNPPPAAASQIQGTNSQEIVQAYLQLQEQLRVTQLAIGQNRQETKEAVAQTAEALAKALQTMQETFTAERARDWKAMQRSNSAVLIVAGTFAAIGLLAMLLMTYFQWRTSRSLTGISTAWDVSRGSGAASDVAALGPGDWRLAPGDPVEQSNLRLLGALEQLDKRIDEFKQAISSGGNGAPAVAPNGGSAAAASEPSQPNEQARLAVLLNKANSLMNLENAEAAVASFDEVLALDPNHTEALVKKGAALERLHKLNEAVECYDRAIAVDSSMTTAYLYKGGLYNRLERFKEALQCYEKALRTHDQRRS